MEVHFMYNNTHTGKSAKTDKKVREEESKLGHDLYHLLGKNEGDLKTYLEWRFHELRDNYDHLTKRNDLLSDTEEAKNLTTEQQEALTKKKENTVYSLTMFQQVLKSLREKEGSSWDDDEKEFNEMIKFVRDAIASLERHTPAEETINQKIITPLKNKWKKFQKNNIATSKGDYDQVF
jgi:hypothetical protein